MESSQMLKHYGILNHISVLPKKLLSLHGNENVAGFVLHDLCNANGFNFQKAAYLVENVDFDCLKGVAGYCQDQNFAQMNIWDQPEAFNTYMQKEPFNLKVRSILFSSPSKSAKSDQETTQIVSELLGLKKPAYCSWNMKHDNRGILIYETPLSCPVSNDTIVNGACLLGFCPIY